VLVAILPGVQQNTESLYGESTIDCQKSFAGIPDPPDSMVKSLFSILIFLTPKGKDSCRPAPAACDRESHS
jgi:hypothetical protein